MNIHLTPEESTQAALFQWAELNTHKYPELRYMFHVPNGGYRHKTTAVKMKAIGQKPGVPDIFLPVPRGGAHGLWIELKHGKNRTTKTQDDYLYFLDEQGYGVTVCYGVDEAVETIEEYLEL